MEQLRRRVTDKRVLRLIRQFLGAGIMRHGSLTATPSGTPQGAILSPLLANVALSVLDRRFEDAWNACTPHQRKWRMAKGHPSYRMIRYADDFVILVRGTKAQAQALKEQTAEFMREQMRLTLSPEKTHITHVDDGFDFLGFRIKRRPRRPDTGRLQLPERAIVPGHQTSHQGADRTVNTIGLSLDELVHALNPILRGWTNYHRHAAAKRCFSYLDHYLWWRVMLWLRKKHPRLTWKQIRRRYWGRNWTSPDGTRLYWPGQVPVTRYRYRGHRIPTAVGTSRRNPAHHPGGRSRCLDQHHDRPAAYPVERRMRGNAHVRCGGRGRANHRAQARHGGSPPTLHLHRPGHPAQRQALELGRDAPAVDRRRDARRRAASSARSSATAGSPNS